MRENYVCEIPSAEELGELYRGLTFEAFMALTDEQVDKLAEIRRTELLAELEAAEQNVPAVSQTDGFDDEFWADFAEASTFRNFRTWRTYGIPDRNVTHQEAVGLLTELITTRQAKDPSYGQLKPEQFTSLPEAEKLAINIVFQYFYNMRAPYEYLMIDDYSLYSTLGLSEADVTVLGERHVLEYMETGAMEGDIYLLTDPYYEHWLVLTNAHRVRQV